MSGWVTYGDAEYRCRIETRTHRGRQQWRWVIERRFVHVRVGRSGWWSRNEAKVRAKGAAVLASYDPHRYEGEYLDPQVGDKS